nr:flavoprotein [Micromonospora sp. DSM 115978]
MADVDRGVLYHLACAAPPALDAANFVQLAQAAGWDVCLLTTPRAAGWLDLPALEALTGHPVRTDYKRLG